MDKALIMQKGKIMADITKEELVRDGMTLEQLFFDVTEGIEPDDVIESEETQ